MGLSRRSTRADQARRVRPGRHARSPAKTSGRSPNGPVVARLATGRSSTRSARRAAGPGCGGTGGSAQGARGPRHGPDVAALRRHPARRRPSPDARSGRGRSGPPRSPPGPEGAATRARSQLGQCQARVIGRRRASGCRCRSKAWVQGERTSSASDQRCLTASRRRRCGPIPDRFVGQTGGVAGPVHRRPERRRAAAGDARGPAVPAHPGAAAGAGIRVRDRPAPSSSPSSGALTAAPGATCCG